jgi:membrane associated rhomboid family serine protease
MLLFVYFVGKSMKRKVYSILKFYPADYADVRREKISDNLCVLSAGNKNMTEDIQHKNNAYFTIPLYFVLILWVVKWAEYKFGFNFAYYGIKPLTVSGLKGILFSPLIHADTGHLFNNSIPVFLLTMALFYFYKPIAWRVLIISWLATGVMTWLIGRNSYHIGASGVIYAFASFLFFSGVFRKHPRLMAISLIVTFLYGSMIWGIFPNEVRISWEGHLSGGLVGLVLAIVFRKIGPHKKTYEWEEEEKELTEDEQYLEDLALGNFDIENNEKEVKDLPDKLTSKPMKYHYHFKPLKKDRE